MPCVFDLKVHLLHDMIIKVLHWDHIVLFHMFSDNAVCSLGVNTCFTFEKGPDYWVIGIRHPNIPLYSYLTPHD